jgi:putative DNA methylase
MEYKKKLIEVALPLEAINRESAREKSIRHGHPFSLHLWWARRPLIAARAILFASLVDDPSAHPDKFPTEEEQEKERQRLFGIIEELVKWENTNNEEVLNKAREEILKSTGGNLPPFYDPFCGGGSIPLEAQRLGLDSYASDLNPVAVLITKALIEIPPKFANMPPVNSVARSKLDFKNGWKGASGLAEDVRYYGKWMRDEAFKRIGHLYPKVKLPKEYGSREATVIAWIWCRTVKCPNPACGAEMPLARSFWLSSKRGTKAWIEPIVNKNEVEFIVKTGSGTAKDGTVNRSGARCICCGTPVSFDYIRSEGKAGRLGKRMMGIVAEGERGRYYLPPNQEHEKAACIDQPNDLPETYLCGKAAVNVPLYGIRKHIDLFTNRQLMALTTFSGMISEVKLKAYKDAISAGLPDDQLGINDGGRGAKAYSEAIATYLAFLIDQLANHQSTINSWNSTNSQMRSVFARQAIPMVWDFAESNPFCNSSGSYNNLFERMIKGFSAIPANKEGNALQVDAAAFSFQDKDKFLISTDPPYYDNIGYADLSDYFYIWLRRSLGNIYPDVLSTVLVPKAQELVATPYRFEGDREKAKEFFEQGLYKAFINIKEIANKELPVTIYYAFKQSEIESNDEDEDINISSTGWETMLEGLIKSGFEIVGTWPIRTEKIGRSVEIGTNALASSIVIVCRVKKDSLNMITRREYLNILRKELPSALKKLQQGNIAPVDLAQAAIGPGMSVFSRYSKVLEADGNPMTVRTALQIINQELDVYLTAQEGDMDTDSRFCIAWYEQFGMNEAPFGEADVLARAKNTSVGRLEEKGVVYSAKGKVRLLKREELDAKWSPVSSSSRDMIWMCTQQLVKALENEGEIKTAELVHEIRGDVAENAKALAYRLYTIAERKGWTEEAYAYNALVVSWPDIQRKAEELAARSYEQQTLF